MKTDQKRTVTTTGRKPAEKLRATGPTKQAQGRKKADAESAASNGGGVAAVERALSILGAFRPGDQALALVEISQRTNLYKSTVLRILQTLLRHNYLQRLEDGLYRVGPTPLILGALYQRSL